ncbi:monocarboxylate transporter 2-like isoform X2 [Amphiura filiformis]|uniref:monocarboxylate transporter 2-like isoform X2 n=1 Tax=Amphiura filiformis TaxID=82378 RepID=UPI003B20E3C2
MSLIKRPNQHLDSGYSWVILFAVTLVEFFELGPVWAALTHHFTYRGLTVSGGVIMSIGLIGASLSQSFVHLGCSMALLSLGSGLPLVAKIVATKDFFEKKFAMANGIAFTGGAVGMTVLAPIIEVLINTYGWRGAMLIYASMNFNICVGGALMIQHERSHISAKQDKQKEHDTSGSPSQRNWVDNVLGLIKYFTKNLGFSVLYNHRILFAYLTAMMIHELVLCGWVLFLVSYTISIGYTAQVASFLSALGGGGALLGRLAAGPFIDKGFISGHMTFFIFLVGGAVMMFCYPFVDAYWLLSLISFMSGFFLGSTSPIYVILLKEILRNDESRFAGSMGMQYLFRSVGMLAGGPLTGWLYDISGNFYFSFMTLAGLEAVGALLIIIRPSLFKRCLGPETNRSSTCLEINKDTHRNVATS